MRKNGLGLFCKALFLCIVASLFLGFMGCSDDRELELEEARSQVKENERKVVAGNTFVVGLCDDGTLVRSEGASKAIDEWRDVVRIDADGWIVAGVCSDGSVVFVAEENALGDFVVDCWTDIVSVSVSSSTIVGLKADGTVVATGSNDLGQCEVADWAGVRAVYASVSNTVGIKEDGTVVVAGQNQQKQKETLSTWTDIVDIAMVKDSIAGLKSDGSVEYCGYYAKEEVREPIDVSTWTDVVDIEMGSGFLLGLKSDGTVVATGDNFQGQCDVDSWKNIVSIKAKWSYSVGLSLDGDVYAKGDVRGVVDGLPIDEAKGSVGLVVSERSFFA